MLKSAFFRGQNVPFIQKNFDLILINQSTPTIKKFDSQNISNQILSIKKYTKKRVLEVTPYTNNIIGLKCSSSNLKLNDKYFESIFESSKIFDNGIHFEKVKDLLPNKARKYIKDNKGVKKVAKYSFNDKEFPIYPKSFFYDYLYCYCLDKCNDIDKDELLKYSIFTDIDFSDRKSFSAARSLCIFTFLYKHNLLESCLQDPNKFKQYCYHEFEVKEVGDITDPSLFTYHEVKNCEGCISIDDCKSNDNNVVVPEFIDGYRVTNVSDYCFINSNKIESISLPVSINKIGKEAFSQCYNLKKIIINSKVIEIGEGCFYNCINLTEIINKEFKRFDSVSLGNDCFNNCNSLVNLNILSKKILLSNN